MSPFTMSLLTGGIFFALDKVAGKRGDKKPEGLPEPPEFTPEMVASFSHPNPETRLREFDPDVAHNVILPALDRRSAVPLRHPDLERVGRVWGIVALQPGQLRASEVVEAAHASGQVVVGSLSLVLVDNGAEDVMILIVGEPGTERIARSAPRCPFAVLSPQRPAEVVETPAPVQNGAASNGAHTVPIEVTPTPIVEAKE